MKTKGRQTIVEMVDVDVDASSFLEKIYTTSIPSGLAHLGSDGFWYEVSGHDYHRNDELYDKVRPATEDELEFRKAYLILRKYVQDNKL